MDYNNKYISELAKSAVFDHKPSIPEKTVDWSYIYKKSSEQNILGLLYCAVDRLSIKWKPDIELLNKWKTAMLTTVSLNAKQYAEFIKINKLAYENNITFVGLKGCVIRTLYPLPELRFLCVRKDANRIHQAVDVFILPSRYEGLLL